MPLGKIVQITTKQKSKKKVLNNKQLTKQVRALSGTEGQRNMFPAFMYNAVALVAGTPNIQYFLDNGLFLTTARYKHHYYDAKIQLVSAGGGYVRLLYGFDVRFDGTNLTANQILDTTTHSASPYKVNECGLRKEAKNKNQDRTMRSQIVWDRLIPLVANERKVITVRLPLYNQITGAVANDSRAKFYPFMLALADDANATIDVGVNYVYTTLD